MSRVVPPAVIALIAGNCGNAVVLSAGYMTLLWTSNLNDAPLALVLVAYFGSLAIVGAGLGSTHLRFRLVATVSVSSLLVGSVLLVILWRSALGIFAFAVCSGTGAACWAYAVTGLWNKEVADAAQRRLHALELVVITLIAGVGAPLAAARLLSSHDPRLVTTLVVIGALVMLVASVRHGNNNHTPRPLLGRVEAKGSTTRPSRGLVVGLVAGALATLVLSGPEQLGVPGVLHDRLGAAAAGGFALLSSASAIGAGVVGLLVMWRETRRQPGTVPKPRRTRSRMYLTWAVGACAPALLFFASSSTASVVALLVGVIQGVFVSLSSVLWQSDVHISCTPGQASRLLTWDRSLVASCSIASLLLVGAVPLPQDAFLAAAIGVTATMLILCRFVALHETQGASLPRLPQASDAEVP